MDWCMTLYSYSNYMTREIDSSMRTGKLAFPVCQLIHSIGKILLTLNALNPLGVDLHTLNALLQGSSYGGVRMDFEELLYFLNLL